MFESKDVLGVMGIDVRMKKMYYQVHRLEGYFSSIDYIKLSNLDE